MRPTRIVLPTPFAVGPVNAYVFVDAPVTLVDPGPLYPPAQEALDAALQEIGIPRHRIERILLTHHHPDHSGYAPALAAETGAEICAHPDAITRMVQPLGNPEASEQLLRRHGVPEEVLLAMHRELARIISHIAPLTAARPVEEGERILAGGDELEAMLLPGHAPGHLAFIGPDYILGGDAVIAGLTPNPILEVDGSGRRKSLPEYIRSLMRLRALPNLPILSGHREEIEDPAPLLTRYLEQIAERRERVLSALGDRTVQAFMLSQEFFPMRRGADPFLALSEVLGHLDLLMESGLVEESEERGRILYRRRA
ncbi:MAG: MBL fold metallo-hydrolase [Thermaerobacter sp.]|nr:MBL fold metallo-hydrolase [Thermaerobacter sp.]